jgi:hypothetical protein
MPTDIILVHGYSVRSLDTYGILPQLLVNNGYNARHVFLSAFDSLNDDITCDDLANALEIRVSALENAGVDIANSAFIVHSTGAIITRRWILNRYSANRPIPSHFISLAGANHGSSLAQLGTMQIVYLFRFLNGGTQVGKEVLQDLDYGSDFLLRINEEWLDAFRSSTPPSVFPFSLIGSDHSMIENQLFWQTHENGSDGTVRISGGNLNYQFLAINQNDPAPVLTVKKLPKPVPHLVLPNISHTGHMAPGPQNGIIGGGAATMAVVLPEIQSALAVNSAATYDALAAAWAARTTGWSAANQSQCDATIVFSLKHPGGRQVQDSLILIKDETGNLAQSLQNVGSSLESRQPIQNDSTPSSISFYVNYPRFAATYPHDVQIQVNSGCTEITYPPISYTVAPGDAACIEPNEFTYIKVALKRDPSGTFELIPESDNPNLAQTWPPLPRPTWP